MTRHPIKEAVFLRNNPAHQMEQIINIGPLPVVVRPILLDETEASISTSKSFIEANTTDCSDIKDSHVMPVRMGDNEPFISHGDSDARITHFIS
jgi:hypothetical protein